jgi:hypothetical protein
MPSELRMQAEGRQPQANRLLDAAHQQLGGSLVVVWDNLTTQVSDAMADLIAARDRLPATGYRRTRTSSTRSNRSGHTCKGPWPTWPNVTSSS